MLILKLYLIKLFVLYILKDDGILVIPTITDPPSKLSSKKGLSMEVHDRAFAMLSIASFSGCCQVLEFYKTQI